MSKLEIFHNQNVERPWTFQKTVSWVQCAEILSEALHSGKRRCLRNPMELTFPSEIGSNRASMTLPQIYLTIIWSDKWMENFLPNYVMPQKVASLLKLDGYFVFAQLLPLIDFVSSQCWIYFAINLRQKCLIVQKWTIPTSFFFIFIFSIQLIVPIWVKLSFADD